MLFKKCGQKCGQDKKKNGINYDVYAVFCGGEGGIRTILIVF